MRRCPITYEVCKNGQKYTEKGLKLLSNHLNELKDFPYTPKQQIQLASELATKISIQGIQPKLSVKLNPKKAQLEVVTKGGKYILKPPHQIYDEVPENEDLTMKLAKITGIEVPFHGMIYNIDSSLSYFIKRFDRYRNQKIAVEDFSQLLECTRDTKYESSMEKIVSVIEKHCTFPMLEKIKLFRLVIFNFLIGNEDMHLKNFTMIRRKEKVELSPAYDLLNTTILIKSQEEIALPIRGKKNKLTQSDLIDYFGKQRLNLPEQVIEKEISNFKSSIAKWTELLAISFLSEKMQALYGRLIEERWRRIN
ncbi:MAG: HipA domain-containing protein [Candidatus Protochlamydia sp.]|nr:HipA domain-containing protein [Candidatus Protochlamydia sp.]